MIEVVIAMGVLAVAIPLVFGALAESGKSGLSSEAETRSAWMVQTCLDEIHASREGRAQFFTTTAVAQTFPAEGDVWALAFSSEGKPIGKLGKAAYEDGVRELNGQAVRYIASLSSATTTISSVATPLLRVRISLEYPSTFPLGKRQKLDFYTGIP